MAIRQIRGGTLPQNRVYEGTCGHCHAQYECLASDLQNNNEPNEGQRSRFSYIQCQTCENKVVMVPKKEKINPWVAPPFDKKATWEVSQKESYLHHIDGNISNNSRENLLMVDEKGHTY